VKPHPYQEDVIAGAYKLWRAGRKRIAAVLATGAGKTVVFSFVAKRCLSSGLPVLVLAHRRELLGQAIRTLREVIPGVRVGLMQGRDKQYKADVVVASVQTASTPASLPLLASRRWGLIIVDECHHSTATTYVRVLRELGAYADDGPPVLGVTATLDRADGEALGTVFEDVIEPQVGLIDLIKQGFLVPPRGVRVKIAELNLDKVKRVAGDFNSGALGRAMSDAMAPKRIVEAYLEHCAPGTPAVAFLPTVAVSIEQAEAFNTHGVPAVHLDGTTPDKVRDQALEDFRLGAIKVLCNVGLFLEGTNLPMIGAVILGRPTSSPTVYVQQVGRGLRTYPGKEFCWVLDVCGVTSRHRLATLSNLNGADRPDETPDDLLMYEEDELLAEAVEPDDEPGEPEPASYADGDLAHELVDLFGKSATAWLRTRGGLWFITAGSAGYLALLPAGPTWPRGSVDLYGIEPNGRRHLLVEGCDVTDAMAAGDNLVAVNPMWQADRGGAWRSQRVRGGATRGEQWDRNAIDRASALLD
jgi:superfamily II DNA or RNA helicase